MTSTAFRQTDCMKSRLLAPAGDYVLLRADTLRLLLPRHEVGTAEHSGTPLRPCPETGLLRPADGSSARRFAALSDRMTLLPHCPVDRFVVTALGAEGDNLGWCWNEVRMLIDVELQLRPLPTVLLARNTPVEQYVEHAGEIAFLCSAHRLREFALMPGN